MPIDPWTLRWVAKPVTKAQGLHILERDHYCCRYCGLDGRSNFESALLMGVDFVMPRVRRGKKIPSNLVACCRSCNLIKGRRTFDSFEEAKQFVLGERENLRKVWEKKMSRRRVAVVIGHPELEEAEQQREPADDDDFPPDYGGSE